MTGKPSWPDGVEPLSIEEFDKLGINEKRELYWDGKRLITRSRFTLTTPQTVLALLAAVASIATIATGLNNASIFLCARDVYWLSCPAAPTPAAPTPAPDQPRLP